jgi:hypothetical protein
VTGHPGVGTVARQLVLVCAQVRAVPPDILLIGTDVGSIALDIPSIRDDVGLVVRDIPLLVSPGALRRIVMPQIGPVGTDVLAVPPDVTAVRADVGTVVSDVTLVPRDVTSIRMLIRLRRGGSTGLRALCLLLVVIITVYVTVQVALIPIDVAPVSAKVCTIPLDVLAVRPDVRPVMRAVAPITRHIVTIVVAGRLRRRLLIVRSGREAVVRIGGRQCRTQNRPDGDGNEVVAFHDNSFVVSNWETPATSPVLASLRIAVRLGVPFILWTAPMHGPVLLLVDV